jgi:hypothetical protein
VGEGNCRALPVVRLENKNGGGLDGFGGMKMVTQKKFEKSCKAKLLCNREKGSGKP